MSIKLSIIVPCYNEAGNIPLIVKKFSELLVEGIEVLLVDNGSTDDSAEVFAQELQNTQGIKLVKVKENKGYGYGILTGLKEAQGEVLAWTHADMQTDPADVIAAYNKYLDADDINTFVKAARKERKLLEAFFSFGMQILASIVLKTPLEEINAQPKLFSRDFYESYLKQGAPDDFSLDLYVLYHAYRNCKIITMPVYFNKRMHGEAKGGDSWVGRINLTRRTLAYLFELAKSLRH
jgi:glycosyltransferase involved in cell wall biosynthesis